MASRDGIVAAAIAWAWSGIGKFGRAGVTREGPARSGPPLPALVPEPLEPARPEWHWTLTLQRHLVEGARPGAGKDHGVAVADRPVSGIAARSVVALLELPVPRPQ